MRRVLGRVNFLDDPSFPPHMKTAELAAAFGVSEATIHAKARLIENALGVSMFDPQWTVSRLIERNPLTWMAEVGGIIVEVAYHAPLHPRTGVRCGIDSLHPGRSGALERRFRALRSE